MFVTFLYQVALLRRDEMYYFCKITLTGIVPNLKFFFLFFLSNLQLKTSLKKMYKTKKMKMKIKSPITFLTSLYISF